MLAYITYTRNIVSSYLYSLSTFWARWKLKLKIVKRGKEEKLRAWVSHELVVNLSRCECATSSLILWVQDCWQRSLTAGASEDVVLFSDCGFIMREDVSSVGRGGMPLSDVCGRFICRVQLAAWWASIVKLATLATSLWLARLPFPWSMSGKHRLWSSTWRSATSWRTLMKLRSALTRECFWNLTGALRWELGPWHLGYHFLGRQGGVFESG